MSENINGYQLVTEFTTNNAGMCQWAFAQKGGHDYFIKQLLYPKYPTENAIKKLSPAMVNGMRSECEAFYARRKPFYDRLLECRTGNVVVVLDFFRFRESYFIVTDRIFGPFLTVGQIASLSDEAKRTLMKAILYSIMQIHEKGIVHADLKPENIMARQTAAGYCTAKLIDFDSGFFEYDVPDEIVGDQRYFSPEAILRGAGRDVPVTVKADVFALGLLFHQYWTGDFPAFDRREYECSAIALLERSWLQLDPRLPADVRDLISRMLEKHQENRPTAKEAWEQLSGMPAPNFGTEPEKPEPPKETVKPAEPTPPPVMGFYIPSGDDLDW